MRDRIPARRWRARSTHIQLRAGVVELIHTARPLANLTPGPAAKQSHPYLGPRPGPPTTTQPQHHPRRVRTDLTEVGPHANPRAAHRQDDNQGYLVSLFTSIARDVFCDAFRSRLDRLWTSRVRSLIRQAVTQVPPARSDPAPCKYVAARARKFPVMPRTVYGSW